MMDQMTERLTEQLIRQLTEQLEDQLASQTNRLADCFRDLMGLVIIVNYVSPICVYKL
jgi:hypothetical protein